MNKLYVFSEKTGRVIGVELCETPAAAYASCHNDWQNGGGRWSDTGWSNGGGHWGNTGWQNGGGRWSDTGWSNGGGHWGDNR